MRSKQDDFLECLYYNELRRTMLEYVKRAGHPCSPGELLHVLHTLDGPRPRFNSQIELDIFHSRILISLAGSSLMRELHSGNTESTRVPTPRPPFNAEYLLYLLLRKEEREVMIGDLLECYGLVLKRFNKQRADIWFYKQVGGSLLPLLRRALVRIGALVWLGRILRRLIS